MTTRRLGIATAVVALAMAIFASTCRWEYHGGAGRFRMLRISCRYAEWTVLTWSNEYGWRSGVSAQLQVGAIR